MAEKKPTFNEALEELESILKEIESGKMDVDEVEKELSVEKKKKEEDELA